MGEYIDALLDAFKKSRVLKLWLYLGIVIVLTSVISLVVQQIAEIPLQMIINPYLSNPERLVSELSSLILALIPLLALSSIIGLLLSSYFKLVYIRVAEEFFRKNSVDFDSVFRVPANKIITMFFINVVIQIIIICLFIIFLLPSLVGIFRLIGSFSSIEPVQLLYAVTADPGLSNEITGLIITLFLNVVAAIFLILLLLLIFSPLLAMLVPVVAFENEGLSGSFRRSITLGFKSYFQSLAYIVLAILLALLFFVVLLVLCLIGFLGGPLLGMLLFIILGLPASLVYIVWLSIFSLTAQLNLYFLNLTHSPVKGMAQGVPNEPMREEQQPWAKAAAKKP